MIRLRHWLLAGSAVAIFACNAWTGSDSLTLGKSDDGAGATSAGGAGGGNTTTTQPTPGLANADGVILDGIKLYQGVERPLMAAGAPASSQTPVVANRPALMRVFYHRDAAYNGQPVTARLTLGGTVYEQPAANLPAASTDSSLSSTINFDIPAAALGGATVYRVEILQPNDITSGANAAAAYPQPANVVDSINPQSSGAQLRIVIVPIRYGADGSNRLPDTSAVQIDRYRNLFMGMYAAASVDVVVTGPMTWNSTVSANGNGWDTLLNWFTNYRQQSGAAPDEYYYGIFNPSSSFNNYCNMGCVLGLSSIAGPTDYYYRAGIGVGFSGDDAAFTAVHEVGHQHGRYHVNCGGAQGIDPNYPYSGGRIGVWGYDIVHKQLMSPNVATDVMGYCYDQWVSDYTFRALFNRIKTVNGASIHVQSGAPHAFDRLAVHSDGTAEFLDSITLDIPPSELETTVTLVIDGVEQTVEGHFVPFDHLPGGNLVVPRTDLGLATRATFAVQGQSFVVDR